MCRITSAFKEARGKLRWSCSDGAVEITTMRAKSVVTWRITIMVVGRPELIIVWQCTDWISIVGPGTVSHI